MSVAQPHFLVDFSDASGATATNKGTKATPYIVTQGVETTDYTRFATGGQYSRGRMHFINTSEPDSHLTVLTTAQAAPSLALQNVNAMVGFTITDIRSATGASNFVATNGAGSGDVHIRAQNKSGSNFDLYVKFSDSSASGVYSTTFSALPFAAHYLVACSLDFSTPTSMTGKCLASLNGAATVTMTLESGSANWNAGAGMFNSWPLIGRSASFTNYGGIVGDLDAFAYGRNETVWSSSDLASISADPSFITGWGGGGGGSSIAAISQRRKWFQRAAARRNPVRKGGGGFVMNERGLLVPDKRILIAA